MACIVISAAGTWGDLLPMLALGKELARRGHAVRVAANKAFHPLVRYAGFEPHCCGPVFGPEEARRLPATRNGWNPVVPEAKKSEAYLNDTQQQFRDLACACKGADLLVAHAGQYAAVLVHEQIRIPWVCVSTDPGQFEHYEYPACTQPAPCATLNLLASSMLFSSPDLEFTNYLYVTGFLFFDGNGLADWQPSQQARAFIENGERVLVLTLGCLPGPGASSVARMAAGAAVLLKRKLVIQPGWADLDTQAMQSALDSGYVHLSEPLPHDWLFARADGVIHFGGAGICARAIRCGVPSLVLPQRADQFFNARCLLELGAGAAMSPTQLTEDRLQRILAEKVLSTACRDAANMLSSEIGKEAGTLVACRQIESLL